MPTPEEYFRAEAARHEENARGWQRRAEEAERQLRTHAFKLRSEVNRIRVSAEVLGSLIGDQEPMPEVEKRPAGF